MANKRSSIGRHAECQRRKQKKKINVRGRERWARERQTESEKEKTQKCGPPGLDADTSEGLLRGGARPYGCMAKRNPRGGSGHISLHGTLHCFLCTAVCGTHRSTDNDIRLSHLRDGSCIPADTAGKRPGAEKKITRSAPRAQSYLCRSIMTAAKTTSATGRGKAETEGVHPALGIAGPFQTTERDS